MKKYYVLVGFFFCLSFQGFSQKSLSDYSYIIVSEQFEFQKEKDKYELNSLTKFLFNKYGFNAYFDREVPNYVRRCDGLWADAEGTPGFIITKVEVVIRDCNGEELFRSEVGKSKVKDYKKAYYEAMRGAFVSIKNLGVNQKSINTHKDQPVVETVKTNTNKPAKITTVPIVANKVIEDKTKDNSSNYIETDTLGNLPVAKFSNYSFTDQTFLLRKTKNGFSFYEESNESDDGLLLIGTIKLKEADLNFIDIENNIFEAQFDASKNLIIKKGDSTVVYKLED